MRRVPFVLGALAIIAVVVAIEAAPQVEIKEAPLTWRQAALGDGEALYAELCAVCHGADGTGNGPAVPALKTPVPDLTKLALNNGGTFPSEEVQKTITGGISVAAHGSSEMPMWGRAFEDVRPDYKPVQRRGFATRRIYDLTVYIESLQVQPEEK